MLLYPFVANQWNNYRQKQLISGYEQVVSEKEAAEGIDYDAERKKAEDYNEALLPCVLPDSFALAESSGVDPVYMNTLNIAGDEMMGSVEIPKINIKIPIYHTTEEEVLNKGAGHLEGSSLPVGGANTHAVISAHRGLPSASLFTDLDQMKVGDHFLLHVLDETLCYEVDKISVVKPEDIDWGEIEPFLDDKLINILLVGQDRYVGTARQRSDTMLLCSINPKTKKVSMISFLRDLYVQIPGGYSDNRLNAAYAFGGFPLMADTFYANFGITIDGFFEVDLAGFRSIVDILDGVDVTLTAREAEVVGVGSEEKLYHLNGKEALSYAQIRKLDSDFGRTQRQRNVMEALYKKFQYADTDTLMKLFQEVLPYLSTNMTNGQIMRLAAKCIPAFGSIELHSYCVPANDSFYYASIREMSVLVPDLDKIRGQLENEYLPLN